MPKAEIKFAVAHIMRVCCQQGCKNVITHFAYPVGKDPRTVNVWCKDHEKSAWR